MMLRRSLVTLSKRCMSQSASGLRHITWKGAPLFDARREDPVVRWLGDTVETRDARDLLTSCDAVASAWRGAALVIPKSSVCQLGDTVEICDICDSVIQRSVSSSTLKSTVAKCGTVQLCEIKIDGLRTLCKERGLKPSGTTRADYIAALESQD